MLPEKLQLSNNERQPKIYKQVLMKVGDEGTRDEEVKIEKNHPDACVFIADKGYQDIRRELGEQFFLKING